MTNPLRDSSRISGHGAITRLVPAQMGQRTAIGKTSYALPRAKNQRTLPTLHSINLTLIKDSITDKLP